MQSCEDVYAAWSGLLSEQNKSGQSAAAFCRDRNLSIKSFAYYRKRLSDKSPAPVKGQELAIPFKFNRHKIQHGEYTNYGRKECGISHALLITHYSELKSPKLKG